MSLSHLSATHLRKAAKLIKRKEGFLAKVREIQFELDSFAVPGSIPEKQPTSIKAPRKRRKMSAATKAKMAAAQQKRWAKVKAKKPSRLVNKADKPSV